MIGRRFLQWRFIAYVMLLNCVVLFVLNARDRNWLGAVTDVLLSAVFVIQARAPRR